jgi:hypothetical protein
MQSNAMLILASIVSFVILGCSRDVKREQIGACQHGDRCAIEGKLNLQAGEPAWAAIVESGDSCAKLALPDSFYGDAKRWNGKKVFVEGRSFRQPDFNGSNGMAVLWYTEKDRKLALGMCDSGPGIYVESMRTKAGMKWEAKPNSP